MDCKKCIHDSACVFQNKNDSWEDCPKFKSVDNFVEVVRCAECVRAEESLVLERKDHLWCSKQHGHNLPDHYCGYGVKKDGETNA